MRGKDKEKLYQKELFFRLFFEETSRTDQVRIF
jgi:hypothetical protein